MLSAAQWRADIDTLEQRLSILHPNFFSNFSASDFAGRMKDLKDHLAGKSDIQIALELQSIVAQAGDAQTHLDVTPFLMKEKVIPFALSAWSDGLYVSATVKRFEEIHGARILSINKLSAADALVKVGRFVAQENAYTNQRDALNWFRFPVALRMVGVTTNDTLTLLVEKKDGKTASVKVYPLEMGPSANREGLEPLIMQPINPDLRWQVSSGFFTQTWLPADSVLYVQYNHCVSREMRLAVGDAEGAASLPSFQEFSDSLFAVLAQKPYAKVLIDLRFNPGGTPSDGIKLAERFAALPKEKRPAQMFVATNFFTQGAATEVAARLSAINGATLIGEPSGTRPSHYDMVWQFSLPWSHITVQFASQYRPIPNNTSTVLAPKVLIPVNFEHFRNGRDPVLDFVRKQ